MTSESHIEESSGATLLATLEYSVGTDVGRRRTENQDYFGVVELDFGRVFIVADGMGGAKGGATASKLAVSVVEEFLQDAGEVNDISLSQAVQKANEQIFEQGVSDESLAGMGTTFVAVAFVDDIMYVVNVGDSRAYRVRDSHISQLTSDHTLVQELLRQGAITSDQAENHPVAHMLTRSLGPTPEVAVDCELSIDGPIKRDRYLLCSDGLYNLVTDSEILKVVSENVPDDAIQILIDLANERGGTDNITVMIVQVGDDYPRDFESLGIAVGNGVNGEADSSAEFERDESLQDLSDDEDDQAAEPADQIYLTESLGNVTEGVPSVEDSKPEYVSNECDSSVDDSGIEQQEARTSDLQSAGEETSHSEEEPTRLETERLDPQAASTTQHSGVGKWAGMLAFGLTMAAVGFFVPRFLNKQLPEATSLAHVDPSVTEVIQLPPDRAEVADQGISIKPELIAESSRVRQEPASPLRLKETSAVSVGSERSTSVRRVPDLSFSHFAVTTNMGKLTTHEVEDIARRKRALRARLGQLEARLTAFTEPISGKLIEGLQELEGERGVAQKRLQSLRDELDIATRKLAIWYGRRQKLATIDPVDLASEVAVTSGKVKLEKEAFEMASWAYLQEVEIWRYNPSDEQLTARMNELGRKRALKRRALSIVVREAVEDAVAKADQRIAEKTLQRDQLQGEIDALQREIDFIKVLTSGSERSKAEKRAELEKERILATEALKELESLVSDEQEASIDTVEALEIVE